MSATTGRSGDERRQQRSIMLPAIAGRSIPPGIPQAWLADVLARINAHAIHRAGRTSAVELGGREGTS